MAARETSDTRLGRAVLPLVRAHPASAGVFALRDGRDAFAVRILLADAAEISLDVQYYIFRNDTSGTLLLAALRRAADRGVHVRLLLDDNNTKGLDPLLAALDRHPEIEVRLFNSFRHRRWRALGYLTDFARLNRRMHNKSFTADDQVTIIGGRNVGDEYFGAGQGVSFVDLDVLAIGSVVDEVSQDFDRYWFSDPVRPAGEVLGAATSTSIAAVSAASLRVESDPRSVAYARAIASSEPVREALEGRLPFEWALTRMVSDDPAKGLGKARDEELLWTRLQRILDVPVRELGLVSPYFVPGPAGTKYFAALAKKGVKITILTNSLEATDVVFVHAGYAKRRKPLLEAGVRLFELQRRSSTPPVRDRGVTGSSGSSLHAKTFSVDRSRVFIGSFNFDPRSARLNTEIGFLIESPGLAEKMAEAFAGPIPARSYEVGLNADGSLRWLEPKGDGREHVHTREPGTGFWIRLAVRVISWLPIEWLL